MLDVVKNSYIWPTMQRSLKYHNQAGTLAIKKWISVGCNKTVLESLWCPRSAENLPRDLYDFLLKADHKPN